MLLHEISVKVVFPVDTPTVIFSRQVMSETFTVPVVTEISSESTEVPKDFLDAMRCRNGNLNIVCCQVRDKECL